MTLLLLFILFFQCFFYFYFLALLGEIPKTKGTVEINGSIAYVPQQPWMQNATVSSNITFGRPYNHDFYQVKKL